MPIPPARIKAVVASSQVRYVSRFLKISDAAKVIKMHSYSWCNGLKALTAAWRSGKEAISALEAQAWVEVEAHGTNGSFIADCLGNSSNSIVAKAGA